MFSPPSSSPPTGIAGSRGGVQLNCELVFVSRGGNKDAKMASAVAGFQTSFVTCTALCGARGFLPALATGSVFCLEKLRSSLAGPKVSNYAVGSCTWRGLIGYNTVFL